jgi:hypothetical protein
VAPPAIGQTDAYAIMPGNLVSTDGDCRGSTVDRSIRSSISECLESNGTLLLFDWMKITTMLLSDDYMLVSVPSRRFVEYLFRYAMANEDGSEGERLKSMNLKKAKSNIRE